MREKQLSRFHSASSQDVKQIGSRKYRSINRWKKKNERIVVKSLLTHKKRKIAATDLSKREIKRSTNILND